MARQNPRRISQRLSVNTEGTMTRLAIHSTANDSHRGVSRATQDVIARVGNLAQGIVQDRTARKHDADRTEGARVRAEEALSGTAARADSGLADYSTAFRRGYFLTEAANKITDRRRELHKTLAAMEPGDDPQPIVNDALSELVQGREFQDPRVMEQITPAVNRLRDEALTAHQKYEMAEVLTRQTENLTQLARLGIQDGSLRNDAGLSAFYETVGGEQYAYLSRDDANDILSAALVDLVETGEVDPDDMTTWLQETRAGNNGPLWDRRNANGAVWSDRFTTAQEAGQRVRAHAKAEAVASVQADAEIRLQRAAFGGRLGEMQINEMADTLELSGSDRLQFVRHWGTRNEAGIRRMEERAAAASRKVDVLGAVLSGNAHAFTTTELRKEAEALWQEAATAGNTERTEQIIRVFADVGVEVPQVRDLLNRPIAGNMSQNYDLYRQLADIDPVLVDRYVTDTNAVLYRQHHDNVTQYGMTAAESLRSLPTGATKDTRPAVEARIGRALADHRRTDAEFDKRPHAEQQRIVQRAMTLARDLPDADPARVIQQAQRRIGRDTVEVNGRRVPRAGISDADLPAVNEFLKRVERDAVEAGRIDPTLKGSLSVTQAPGGDPGDFVVTTAHGFPVVHPNGRDYVSFNARELSAAKHEFDTAAMLDQVQAGQLATRDRVRNQSFMGTDPQAAAAARINRGTGPVPGEVPQQPAANLGLGSKRPGDTEGQRTFVDYLIEQKRGR